MKTLLTTILALLMLPVYGNEITRGTTLTDGQQLYASDLHGLIDNSTIGVQFYSDKSPAASVPTGYEFLALDTGNQVYMTVTAQQLLYGNSNIWLYPSQRTTFPTYALWQFYDPTNVAIRTISATNAEMQIAGDLGTNYALPYVYRQLFFPFNVYGTNTVTNLWGTANSFPITNLTMGAVTQNTLTDTDAVPVLAGQQGTNTTTTLATLGQYFQSKNYLPANTAARCIFSGNSQTNGLAPTANTIFDSLYVTNSPLTATVPLPFCFLNSGSSFYFAGEVTNWPYFAVAFATNTSWFRVYTNYVNAAAQTNWVDITASAVGNHRFVWTTNYTSYNCDVTPLTSNSAIPPGYFTLTFRTPSQTPYYYVSGSCSGSISNQAMVMLADSSTPNTNQVRLLLIDTMAATAGNAATTPNLVHVVINPQ